MSEYKFDGNTLPLYGYTTESKFTFSRMPLGDLRIVDDKVTYIYRPKEDITAFELSKLLHLFVVAMTSSGAWAGMNCYDYRGFIMQNALERHFEKVEN